MKASFLLNFLALFLFLNEQTSLANARLFSSPNNKKYKNNNNRYPSSSSTTASFVRGGYVQAPSPLSLTDPNIPTPGSSYGLSVRIPFLGKQTFRLNVDDETSARLSIAGAMSVDATIDYNISPNSGNVSFSLPDSVQAMMKKFRTKLLEARYLPDSDSVLIKVLPPLPRHISLKLNRVQ